MPRASLSKSSDTARLDSELLMAEALHIDRDKLLLSPPDRQVPKRFWDMVERRKAGEPVAYITGRRAFWNIELHVGPGVLVPRPDSEVLIASAIEHFEGTEGPKRILDLGTGPGTLLLAALDVWPDATGLGIDVSRQAHVLCRGQRAPARVRGASEVPVQGDWAKGLKEKFDLILCNPPYVAGRRRARRRGSRISSRTRPCSREEKASTRIARSAPQLPGLLAQGGLAAVEIGHDQAAAVTRVARRATAYEPGSRRTSAAETAPCC